MPDTFGDSRLPERFWAKVSVAESECWMWSGEVNANGYGRYWVVPKEDREVAHRVAYEALVGPIPDGMVLDHECHTRDGSCTGGNDCLHRRCVNPAHLAPVTPVENMQRGVQARRTHCPQGHEYTPDNTYLRKDRVNGTQRQCRACTIARARRQEEHRKAARNA